MDFLAVCPGVHSVDALTLTDIETGFCMNLRFGFCLLRLMSELTSLIARSVIDIVVHDAND